MTADVRDMHKFDDDDDESTWLPATVDKCNI